MGTKPVARLPRLATSTLSVALVTIVLLARRRSRIGRFATDGGTNPVERRSRIESIRSRLDGIRTTPGTDVASGDRPVPAAVQFGVGADDHPVEERIARYRSREARR